MKILVVGGGGREHALVHALSRSPQNPDIRCAPGNAGIAAQAQCVSIGAEDIDELLAYAQREAIELTVVGPEAPLAAGIVDRFAEAGLRCFGPSRAAAQLEASKEFCKAVMSEAGVPTAAYAVFTDEAEALAHVQTREAPMVVKADGLAAGKGVVVAATRDEAAEAVRAMMGKRAFGEAGARVVIEDCLIGEEASYICICDGEDYVPLASSQDHKRALDRDRGPNTGGMGAYSPAPVVDAALETRVCAEVIEPLLKRMAARGTPFSGVLYAGLMIVDGEPYVLEFNVRFGDPECQPLMMRLQTDLLEIIERTLDHRLSGMKLEWDARPAVCVVMASGGYPGAYEKGQAIAGLAAAGELEDCFVYHAGTALQDGQTVTSGGRVLGVTALGADIATAIEQAYRAVDRITWPGAQARRDIGRRALERMDG